MADADVALLRELAYQVAEIAAKDVQEERRRLWRSHNSLKRTRPLIYVRWFACWQEVFPDSNLQCVDPFYRYYERYFRQMIHQDALGDDFIIEPWVTVRASYAWPGGSRRWGPEIRHIHSGTARGAWKFDPPIRDEADLSLLVKPEHRIDEAATARNVERLGEAIGDILPIAVDRGPAYRVWTADLSTDLAHLRGLEQMMWDMCDRPDWLHQLVGFLRDGVLATHDQAEQAGDWRLCNHENQAMPYAEELPDPSPDPAPVPRKRLWGYFASQEFAQVGPAMWHEFLLSYQRPIMDAFGLIAYGCCEDLTRKIPYLREIPNLRRIAVTPWADVAACAEQIGEDYVLSWRPSPAEMICTGFEPARVRQALRAGLAACRGCHVDITLKDVETIGGNFANLQEWARIAREVAEEFA